MGVSSVFQCKGKSQGGCCMPILQNVASTDICKVTLSEVLQMHPFANGDVANASICPSILGRCCTNFHIWCCKNATSGATGVALLQHEMLQYLQHLGKMPHLGKCMHLLNTTFIRRLLYTATWPRVFLIYGWNNLHCCSHPQTILHSHSIAPTSFGRILVNTMAKRFLINGTNNPHCSSQTETTFLLPFYAHSFEFNTKYVQYAFI